MSEHTPGPWMVNRHYIEAESGLCRARIAIIDDGAGTNPEANAALIAAAPDMLQALVGMLMSQDCEWENKDQGHDWAEACRVARRAITKAKGES